LVDQCENFDTLQKKFFQSITSVFNKGNEDDEIFNAKEKIDKNTDTHSNGKEINFDLLLSEGTLEMMKDIIYEFMLENYNLTMKIFKLEKVPEKDYSYEYPQKNDIKVTKDYSTGEVYISYECNFNRMPYSLPLFDGLQNSQIIFSETQKFKPGHNFRFDIFQQDGTKFF
jgi:hypothetical protein